MADLTFIIATNDNGAYDNTTLEFAADDPYFDTLPPSAIIITALSAVAGLLCLPTLVWHGRNRNIPATLMVFWIVLANAFNVVNALLWPTDDVTTWPSGVGYCDVQIRLDLAGALGTLGAVACIMRQLAAALDTDRARLSPSPSQRRRRIAFEILYCGVLPLYIIVVHAILQPNRYAVFGISGCMPTFSDAWLSLVLAHAWPPAVALIAAYYASLVLVRLRRYRKQFATILAATSSGLSRTRFVRLFSNAAVLLIIYMPLQLFMLARNASYPITAWNAEEMRNPERWRTVAFVPSYGEVWPDHWLRPAMGFTVFACFGLGAEAKALYREWLIAIGFSMLFPKLECGSSGSGSSSSQGSASKLRQLFKEPSSPTFTNSTHSCRFSQLKSKLALFSSKLTSTSKHWRTSFNLSQASPMASDYPLSPITVVAPALHSPALQSPFTIADHIVTDRTMASPSAQKNIITRTVRRVFPKKAPSSDARTPTAGGPIGGANAARDTREANVNGGGDHGNGTRAGQNAQQHYHFTSSDEAVRKAAKYQTYEDHVVSRCI